MTDSLKTNKKNYSFWLVLIAAIIVLQIPIVSIPFKWLESYFHEISHGIAAIATGGAIVSIQLFPNGAGLCVTQGGSNFLISLMGYAGAILWGVSLYVLGGGHRYVVQGVSIILFTLLALTLAFWVGDLLTAAIIVSLFIIVCFQYRLNETVYIQKFTQFIGIIVLLNSILSPLYLLDGRSRGDGAALSDITFIPEIVWVVLWSVSGICCVIYLARKS